jgi:hypothetical protein
LCTNLTERNPPNKRMQLVDASDLRNVGLCRVGNIDLITPAFSSLNPMQRFGLLVRVLSPMAYLAAGAAAPHLPAWVIVHLPGFQGFGETPAEVEGLFLVAAIVGFAVATLLLLKVEGQRRPSIWDHFRQSALWYAFGISWWSKLLGASQPPSLIDTMVMGLLPLAAILANALVIGVLRAYASITIPWPKSRPLLVILVVAAVSYVAAAAAQAARRHSAPWKTVTWNDVPVHVHVDEEIVREPSFFTLYDRRPQPAGSLVLLRVKQELFDSARRKCPTSTPGCALWSFGVDSNVRCLLYRGTSARFVRCRFTRQDVEARFTCSSRPQCATKFANLGLDYEPIPDPD